ncbi:P-loop NTPase, partial [Eubacterium aggregans]
MSEEQCTHDCNTCGSDCGDRQETDFSVAPHPMSQVKTVIGVVSGKGGVGKSLVTSEMAVTMRRRG